MTMSGMSPALAACSTLGMRFSNGTLCRLMSTFGCADSNFLMYESTAVFPPPAV
jgi:hypothetical protein